MKKFLTIALLVMALCVVSVVAYAEGETTEIPESANITVKDVTSDNVVSVTVPAPSTAGQTVLLVVKGTEKDIVKVAGSSSLEEDIIYVDQATATTSKEFSFIPRDDYKGAAVAFTSYGSAVEVKTLDTTYYPTYPVTLNLNGATIADGKNITSIKKDATVTLPVAADLTKVGYVFGGWYADASFAGAAVESITGAPETTYTYYAKWTPNFAAPETADDIDTDGVVAGADKVADARAYKDGEVEKYEISVSTKITEQLKTKNIVGFGFHVYNSGQTKSITVKNETSEAIAALKAGDGFYAVANGITGDYKGVNVFFKAFVITEQDGVLDYSWGASTPYSVNQLLGISE